PGPLWVTSATGRRRGSSRTGFQAVPSSLPRFPSVSTLYHHSPVRFVHHVQRCLRSPWGTPGEGVRYHSTMLPSAPFPQSRPRRLRRPPRMREALADVTLPLGSLIYPLFVTEAESPRPVASMPGISQLP